jgi:hypothetical protein
MTMRWILAAGLLAMASSAQAADRTYANARFGYTIAYPAELIPQPEAENGDGRAFRSRDGTVEALAWGAYNSLDDSVAALARQAEADCTAKPSYQRIAASFFAISCRAGANILYEKMQISGDVESAFRITYPAAAHAHWDAVTARMSASLTEGH